MVSDGTNLLALTVGTNGQILEADSAQTLGIKWTANPSGLWTVLGDYEATVAEGSHTFSFSAVDFDDDSELMLIIDLDPTAAFNLLLRVNGNSTSNYFVDGSRISVNAETLIDLNTQSSFQLASNSVFSLANREGFVIAHIGLTKAGTTTDVPIIQSFAQGGPATAHESAGGMLNVNTTSISSIVVLTSTSTWKIGSRMTLYKLARA